MSEINHEDCGCREYNELSRRQFIPKKLRNIC
mgnify:CR=1 FL=1